MMDNQPSRQPPGSYRPEARFANLDSKMNVFPAVNIPKVLLRSDSSVDLSVLTQAINNMRICTHPTHATNPVTFTKFSELPVELQLKIWNEAARESRIIQLVPAKHHLGDQGSHLDYAISRSSLKVPAVLHICHNSRTEALAFYEKRTFQHAAKYRDYPLPDRSNDALEDRFLEAEVALASPEKEHPFVYFNPVLDALLFGEDTCIGIMLEVFRLGQEIQQVGFFTSMKGCCGGDITSSVVNESAAVKILKALHGDTTEPALHMYQGFNPNAGCRGLKEVMVVVKSKLWNLKSEEINELVGWRPARCTGITNDEMSAYSILDRSVQLCKQGVSLWDKVPFAKPEWNKWTGTKLPRFNYVNFAPIDTENTTVPKHLDGMKISKYSMTRIRHLLTPDALMKAEVESGGCQLFILEQSDSAEEVYEVGLWGTKASNERAKIKVREMIKNIMQQDSKKLVDSGTYTRLPSFSVFDSFLEKRRR
ncbi:uncharacterized protein PAC_05740 [Phialocephala subalpina]|uniref:2EXR domain-containing protein n=1 Tax=Phialocephala subalpina TaxID=576137 RepID=A0A1L7WSW3_9HELO|nr:uncharacterized protein PAC_05740 [Phialocephala subalpina]